MYERFTTLVESMYDDSEERLLAGEARRRARTVDANRLQKRTGGDECEH